MNIINTKGVDRENKFLFPNYVENGTAYILGCDSEQWSEFFELSNLYCSLNKIKTIVFIWDQTTIKHSVTFVEPVFDRNSMNFQCGTHTYFNGSIRNTIKPYNNTYLTVLLPKIIPISSENPSCVDIVNSKNINVYFDTPSDINICKTSSMDVYIGKALSYSSANAFKGVVFKCGKKTGNINTMTYNIITGIKSKQALCSKFILTLEFGQNSLFKTLQDFVSYMVQLRNNEQNISICIDLNELSKNGHEPYFVLKNVHKYLPIDFVTIGRYIIPYFQYKIIEYCKSSEIILFRNDI